MRYALSWRHARRRSPICRNLKAIFSLGAGVDHVLVDPRLPEAPIVRVVDPDLTARMSEWVVLQVLLHFRQFRLYDRQQRERIWAEDEAQPAAPRCASAFWAWANSAWTPRASCRRSASTSPAGAARPSRSPGLESFHGREGLDALLARTDILVSLLPLTPETRGLLERFAVRQAPRATAGSAGRS